MAVAGAICGLLVFGSQNGGNKDPSFARLTSIGTTGIHVQA